MLLNFCRFESAECPERVVVVMFDDGCKAFRRAVHLVRTAKGGGPGATVNVTSVGGS